MKTDVEFRPSYIMVVDTKSFFHALDNLPEFKCITVFYGDEGAAIWVRSAYNWGKRNNKRMQVSPSETAVMITWRALKQSTNMPGTYVK